MRLVYIAPVFVAILAYWLSVRSTRETFRPVGTTVTELRDHLISLGGDLDKVVVRTSKSGGGRSIVAARDIQPDETIFVVPRSMLLSAATFSGRTRLRRATRDWALDPESFPDMYLDALVLMYERLQRNESKWANYFHTLPAANPLPYTEPSFDPAALSSVPHLEAMVRERRDGLAAFFPSVVRALGRLPSGSHLLRRFDAAVADGTWTRKYFPAGYQAQGGPEGGGPWDSLAALRQLYLHAYACAKTRSCTEYNYRDPHLPEFVEQFGVMAPFFDLTNHDSFDYNAEVIEVEGGLGLGAVRPIPQGTEILFSYRSAEAAEENDNPGCNWRWFVEYGFVLTDRVEVRACYGADFTIDQLAELLSGSESSPSSSAAAAALRKDIDGAGHSVPVHLNGFGLGAEGLLEWIVHVAQVDEASARRVALQWAELQIVRVEGRAYEGRGALAQEAETIRVGALRALTAFRHRLKPAPAPPSRSD